jgi:hypothetical protein
MTVLRRAAVVGALAVALLVPNAAPAQTPPTTRATATTTVRHWPSFMMPSRNIACLFNSAKLRCDILSGLEPEPTGPCDFFWKGVMLPATGRASFLCIIDTVYDENAPVLGYGTTWRRDGVTCRSRRTGLRCHNRDGHGFLLSRRLSKKW